MLPYTPEKAFPGMSNSLRSFQNVFESENKVDPAPVVLPTLISTLDVYMDASVDQRFSQIVDKDKTTCKKKATCKATKKPPLSNVMQIEPLAALDSNHLRPESRLPSSKESPRAQYYHLRDYSSGDHEDYNFDSLSLESASKNTNERKIHISSPPPSSDRKQLTSRPNFTPYSPNHILVQLTSSLGGQDVVSPGANTRHSHHSPPAHHTATTLKSDLRFGKAVQSIAAIKLNNFGMKRRDHVSHKLKALCEIWSFEKENNADLVVAQKVRKDELLAAWKIRYYVEHLRLNSLCHVVDHTTQRNLDLEEECSLLQQTSAVAEIENESLTKEIARLSGVLADTTQNTTSLSERLNAEVVDLRYQLDTLQATHALHTTQSSEHTHALQQSVAQGRAALIQEQHTVEQLQSELSITRLTCQELVRAGAQKDGEMKEQHSTVMRSNRSLRGEVCTTGCCYWLALLTMLLSITQCSALMGDIDLNTLAGPVGFTINGATANDNSGWSVKTAGDVNGDGVDDVIVGANGASPVVGTSRSGAGISYVLFGRSLSVSGVASYTDIDLLPLNTAGSALGFAILGAVASGNSGQSVSAAGDVNGDGLADVIVGAFNANPVVNGATRNYAGMSYVIFGRSKAANLTASYTNINLLPLNTAGSVLGFAILGAAANDNCGTSVSAAGDVNGDGLADVIVGAYMADPVVSGTTRAQAGISYVIFGRLYSTGSVSYSNINLLPINTAGSALGFAIFGAAADDLSGCSVSAAGDVNGDGLSDVIVGARNADPVVSGTSRGNAGISYMIFGRNKTTNLVNAYANIDLLPLNTAGSILGFAILGAANNVRSGGSVSTAGDVNGDGLSDVIVGANYASPVVSGTSQLYAGISYVLFGRSKAITLADSYANIDLLPFNSAGSALGFAIIGAAVDDNSGWSVSAAGDVNGDGGSDVIVGAYSADPVVSTTRNNAGISYVIFGRHYSASKPTAYYTNIDLARFSPVVGFRILGVAANDLSGCSVSAAGDVNQDGLADVIVGANNHAGVGAASGASYVIFGALSAPTSQPSSQPSRQPSRQPSSQPSRQPTAQPSAQPSRQPSSQPSRQPSRQPSSRPTAQPSRQPSARPSSMPSGQPSSRPSAQPTVQPSGKPSAQPSAHPSLQPSSQPSVQPSAQPVLRPTSRPSAQPSSRPSAQPSTLPSTQPSPQPTSRPSVQPSVQPSGQPSMQPLALPSTQPSSQPSVQPSAQPVLRPTSRPSAQPSGQPSSPPSSQPTQSPTSQPSLQPSVQPNAQPTSMPSSQPSGQPSSQPSTQPSQRPRAAPSAQPTGQPTTVPSAYPTISLTGEWATLVNQAALLTSVNYANGCAWSCGAVSAICILFSVQSGEMVSQFRLDWSSVTVVLNTAVLNQVVIVGHSVTNGVRTSEVATCTTDQGQLNCQAQSFHDTKFLAASYVPYPNKIVYVGWNNVRTSITATDVKTGVIQSYLYTASNMKALTLSQIQSPPAFVGSIVAGTAVRATATPVNYIMAGMFRTDGGSLRAMVVMPVSGDILNSADLVTAMALEYTGPDAFIAGGLQLADVAGTHAYLLRANVLFNTISYCVRYTNIMGGRRALSTSTTVLQSVVRGMVRVENTLFMILDRTSNSITALTVLKTSIMDGTIDKQVHVNPPNSTNLHCTDISGVDTYLSIVCTLQGNASAVQSVVILVDQALSFTKLPVGFLRSDNIVFQEESLPFQRTALSITQTPATLATSAYQFNTADQTPTRRPSLAPSYVPTSQPSSFPSGQPSSNPTAAPSVSARPTSQPSSAVPTITHRPTVEPTVSPTKKPSAAPTARPSFRPTIKPSARPTPQPTVSPTVQPSASPTLWPTRLPSVSPSHKPTREPTQVFFSVPTLTPTTFQQYLDSIPLDSNRPSFVMGASVGGGLGALLIGYVLYKVYEHYEEKRARALRKIDYMKKQALLAIQRDAEIAKYIQDEEDRNAAFRLQEEQEYEEHQQRKRAKKKTKKSNSGGGAYATGSVQLPPPAVQQDSADRASIASSNYSISTLHSSEMSSALYDATHYTTEEEEPAVVGGGEQLDKAMKEGSAVPSSGELSDFAESIIGLSDSHKSDSSENSGEETV